MDLASQISVERQRIATLPPEEQQAANQKLAQQVADAMLHKNSNLSFAAGDTVTSQSTNNAQEIYNQALDNAATAQGYQGPASVVAPGQTAAQLDAGKYYANTNTTAQVEDASLKMKAYNAALAQASDAAVQNVAQANTTNVAAVQGADVAKVNTKIGATQIGDAAQTGGVSVGGTTLDPLANQLRTSQIQAAQKISDSPSAAMSQFQAGQSQVVKDQLAMAAAARGSERAGARREAMINAGAGGAQANLSAAALSAQEQQAKNVAASAALTGIRSQDVTTSTTQAQIDSQRQQLQAQIDSAIAQGNTAAVNTLKAQQAQLNLQADTSSVQAGLNQQGTLANVAQSNTALQQQKAVADAAAANKAAADYAAAQNAAAAQLAQNQTGVSQSNAAATTGASKDYTNAFNAAAQTTASQQSATNLANTALAQQQAQTNAGRALTADTTNVTGQNAVSSQNAANSIGAQTTNASNQLGTASLQQGGSNAALNTGVAATGIQSKNASTIAGSDIASNAAEAQRDAALVGGAAAVGAAAATKSDIRAKDDVRPVGGLSYAREMSRSPYESVPEGYFSSKEAAKKATEHLTQEDVDRFAESARPITWHYKPGIDDGGKEPHLGLSAQDLEASGPLGQMMVSRDPKTNLRTVDYGAATLMLSKAAFEKANEAKMLAERGRR